MPGSPFTHSSMDKNNIQLKFVSLTPGEVFQGKVIPISPFNREGAASWVNVSLYTSNFTYTVTSNETTISLEVKMEHSTGVSANAFLTGNESPVDAGDAEKPYTIPALAHF